MAANGEDGGSGAGIDGLETSGTASGPRRAATDWDRYGLTRAARPSARGFRPGADVHGSFDSGDDLYAQYRREPRAARYTTPRQHPRARANVAGLSLLAAVAAAFLVAGIVATNAVAKPTPSVRLSTATVTPTPVDEAQRIPLSVTVDLPAAVTVPDRATVPDDGITMYLAGSDGEVAVNSASRDVKLLQGPAFAPGIGRHLVAGGKLWSGSFDPIGPCDPRCWDQSTTFMVDATTEHVDKTFAGTYLVGYDGGSIWIASRAGVQKLDPTDGNVQDSVPWAFAAEPRVGCGGLWARSGNGSDASLTRIDAATGEAIGKPGSVGDQILGPVQVDGGCWVIDVDVAGIGGAEMTQLAADGSISRVVSSELKVVILDGEFWTCAPEGVMQRLHPGSGPYGPQIQLAVTSVSGYPNTLFASLHTIWMLDYQGRLIGFDVATGAGSAGS